MTYELMPYQSLGCDNIIRSLISHQSVCAVAPGGSGKSIIMANLANRFIQKNPKRVCIFLHSEILLNQIRKILYDWFDIYSQEVNAKTKELDPSNKVFCVMVETFDRRIDSKIFAEFFHPEEVGLLIIDECHRGNFFKIYDYFPCKRIGFTATPISSQKKKPLKNFFEDIIIIATAKQMQDLNQEFPERGCVPVICYSPKGVDRSSLKIGKDGEYDEKYMSGEYRKKRQLENTVEWYLKLCYGKKTLIFNADIEHSLDQTKAFNDLYLPCRHLDGTKSGKYGSDKYKAETLKWFSETSNAILCNVGVLTTGYDEKSIEWTIINKAVISESLWIQMVVRVTRPYKYKDGTYKEFGGVIDMGNNAPPTGGNLGDTNTSPDWVYRFFNPNIPKPGVQPIKLCPSCGAMNPISARICAGKRINPLDNTIFDCLYIFPVTEKEQDLIPIELVRYLESGISVKAIVEFFKDKPEFRSYHEIVNNIVDTAKNIGLSEYLCSEQIQFLFDSAYNKTGEWFKFVGRRRFPNQKESLMNELIDNLKNKGFILPIEEILELNKEPV